MINFDLANLSEIDIFTFILLKSCFQGPVNLYKLLKSLCNLYLTIYSVYDQYSKIFNSSRKKNQWATRYKQGIWKTEDCCGLEISWEILGQVWFSVHCSSFGNPCEHSFHVLNFHCSYDEICFYLYFFEIFWDYLIYCNGFNVIVCSWVFLILVPCFSLYLTVIIVICGLGCYYW